MSGPMYLQIAETLRTRVFTGTYRPGQVLPTERELMEEFSVSRVTTRRALKELIQEALVDSRQGSGYVVAMTSHLNQPLNRVTSFTEDCARRGLTPGSILIDRKLGKSRTEENMHFAVPPKTDVMRIRRIRTGNGEPLLVEHVTLLSTKAPLWPWPDGSLYRAMKELNIIPTRVQQQYVPVLADKILAKHLLVTKDSPLMLVVRAGFAEDNSPVEYARCWFRPDRWTFAHEIRR